MKTLSDQTVEEIIELLSIDLELADMLKKIDKCSDDIDVANLSYELSFLCTHLFEDFYHNPSISEIQMLVYNNLLGGHGIEGIEVDPNDYKNSHINYVNVGDMYINTICEYKGNIYISSYENEVNKLER